MKIINALFAFAALSLMQAPLQAAEYDVDPTHSFIEFRIKHLGYSWLYGRFNTLSGTFSHDPADPAANKISLQIDPNSVDTNHAERDKHIRSGDFLDVDNFSEASFVSTGYSGSTEEGVLEGTLTVHGVSKPISIAVKKIGEGKDPWGGYRAGFAGTLTLDRRDLGVTYDLGPTSWEMELNLSIEGIRK